MFKDLFVDIILVRKEYENVFVLKKEESSILEIVLSEVKLVELVIIFDGDKEFYVDIGFKEEVEFDSLDDLFDDVDNEG